MQATIPDQSLYDNRVNLPHWNSSYSSSDETLQYRFRHLAGKLRYKSKRTKDYVNRMNEVIIELNGMPASVLSNTILHRFFIVLRSLIRDLLLERYSPFQANRKEETYLLGNCVRLCHRLVHCSKDVTLLTSYLLDSSLINALSGCLSDIDQLLAEDREKKNFKHITRLFHLYSVYYQRLPSTAKSTNEFHVLFEATMECLASSRYDRTFRKLKPSATSLTTEEKFFFIQCPSFLTSYQGQIRRTGRRRLSFIGCVDCLL